MKGEVETRESVETPAMEAKSHPKKFLASAMKAKDKLKKGSGKKKSKGMKR